MLRLPFLYTAGGQSACCGFSCEAMMRKHAEGMVRSVGCSIGYSVPRGQRTRERWRGLCWVLRGTDGGKADGVGPSVGRNDD